MSDDTAQHTSVEVTVPAPQLAQQAVTETGVELVKQLRVSNARQMAMLVGLLGVLFGDMIIVGILWAATMVQEHHLPRFSYSPLLNVSLFIVLISLIGFALFWVRAEWRF